MEINRGIEHNYGGWNVHETQLSELAAPKRGAVLSPNTPVDIAKNVDISGREQYVLFFQYPFTSSDLITTLFGFSEDTLNVSDIETSWRQEGYSISPPEQQFLSGKRLLADLLKSPDDGDFINSLSTRLRTGAEAWQLLLKEHAFPKALIATVNQKVQDLVLAESAKKVPNILRKHPEFWPDKPKRHISRVSDVVALGRFMQLGENARGAIMDEQFADSDYVMSKKKRHIEKIYGINYELVNENNEQAYLLGKRKDEKYESYGGQVVRVVQDKRSAEIYFQDNGNLIIYPQSGNFQVPYLQWEVGEGDERRFVFNKPPVVTRNAIKKQTHNRNVFVQYEYRNWQANNQLLGLLVTQNLLREPLRDFPLEWAPAIALLHQDELLGSDLIKRAEEVAS